jgi:PBP1b-binding outer membrane lipoprotein LpoB
MAPARFSKRIAGAGLMILALAGCSGASATVASTQPTQEPSATQPEHRPAVEPTEVRQSKGDIIRVFKLKPNEALSLERGGRIKFLEVTEDHVLLKRKHKWKISSNLAQERHVGSGEYIKIISTRRSPQRVTIELRTRDRPWWDHSF